MKGHGHIPWNKGKKMSDSFKEKISLIVLEQWKNGIKRSGMKGKHHSEKTKQKQSIAHLKEKSWRWNPNRDEVRYDRRNDPEYKQWRKEVFKRDRYKCKINNDDCDGRMEAHHILPWKDYPEERYNINNGITLCQAHHPRKRIDEQRLISVLQELVGSYEQ